MNNEKQKSIGALWSKTNDKGTYYTGEIELDGKKTKLVVFKNNYKEKDTQPDYKIYISQPREEKHDNTKETTLNVADISLEDFENIGF